MDSLIEPDLLFIPRNAWDDEESRDEAISRLLAILNLVNKYKITRFYWSDQLEELLWSSPHFPPWKEDRSWKSLMISRLHGLLNSNTINLGYLPEAESCVIDTNTSVNHQSRDITDRFQDLGHALLGLVDQVPLFSGDPNRSIESPAYIFKCLCHSEVLNTMVIQDPLDLFKSIDYSSILWPEDCSENSHKNLRSAIELTAITLYKKTADDFKYEFSFSSRFMKALATETEDRSTILSNLTKRLLLTKLMASRDNSLMDESVHGEQRFRASRARRVHYTLEAGRKLLFENYYSAGEHDVGLR